MAYRLQLKTLSRLPDSGAQAVPGFDSNTFLARMLPRLSDCERRARSSSEKQMRLRWRWITPPTIPSLAGLTIRMTFPARRAAQVGARQQRSLLACLPVV